MVQKHILFKQSQWQPNSLLVACKKPSNDACQGSALPSCSRRLPCVRGKAEGKNNHVSPKSFLLMKPSDTRASKQTSPSLRIPRISLILLFWSAKSTFITITIKFPFSNSILHICADWNIYWKKIGHDRYMSRGTGVFMLLLHQCNTEATVPSLCIHSSFPLHLSYYN